MTSRVCIVTPSHLAANPRVVKEASALVEAGYHVHVVHGHYAPWHAKHDPSLSTGFTTTKVAFGPRLASKTAYLRQSLLRHGARVASRIQTLRQHLAATALAPVTRDLTAAALRVKADLYIGHYTPALAAVAAAAKRHAAIYAFDAEDFHLGDLPDEPRHVFEKALIQTIEAATLGDASFVTAASPGIADAYAETYGILPPTVVLNAFPKSNAPSAPSARGRAEPGPSVYWFSQTLGPGRGLECAVEAMALAKTSPHLYLRGRPASGYQRQLHALTASRSVADRVHILSPEAPDQMEQLASAYDVGFVGETGKTRNHQIALSNKQFTYLLAGLPAVMSDVPAHRAFARDATGAVSLYRTGDPADLARVLDALLGGPARLAAARSRAYALGQSRYNWDVEKNKLLAIVANALGHSA